MTIPTHSHKVTPLAIAHSQPQEVDENTQLANLRNNVTEIGSAYSHVLNVCESIKSTLSSLKVPTHSANPQLDLKRYKKAKYYCESAKNYVSEFNKYETSVNDMAWAQKIELTKLELDIASFVKKEALDQMHNAVGVKEKARSDLLQAKIKAVGSSMDTVIKILSDGAKLAAEIALPMLAGIPALVSQAATASNKDTGACEQLATNLTNILQASNEANQRLLTEAIHINQEAQQLATDKTEALKALKTRTIGANSEKRRLATLISILRNMISLANEEIIERRRIGRDENEVILALTNAVALLSALEREQLNCNALFDAVTAFSSKKLEELLPGIKQSFDEAKEILTEANEYLLHKQQGNPTGYHVNSKDKTQKDGQYDDLFVKRRAVIKKMKALQPYNMFQKTKDPSDEMKILTRLSRYLQKEFAKLVKSKEFFGLSQDDKNKVFINTAISCINKVVMKNTSLPLCSYNSDLASYPEIRNQTILLMKHCKAIFPACQQIDSNALEIWIKAQTSALTNAASQPGIQINPHKKHRAIGKLHSLFHTAKAVISHKPANLAPLINAACNAVSQQPTTVHEAGSNYQPTLFREALRIRLDRREVDQLQTIKLKMD